MKHMHSENIAHGALQPANVLITEDCSIKITGFGSCIVFDRNDDTLFDAKMTRKASTNIQASTNRGKMSMKNKRKSLVLKKQKRKAEEVARSNPDVVQAWYTPPEQLLSETRMNTLAAGNMWSVGAIFAELLQMQQENRPDPWKRAAIFGGLTYFSPMSETDKYTQLQVIFDVIGSPDKSEIAKSSAEKPRTYLSNLPQRRKKDLKEVFPGADEHALDLLARLLMFDVEKRMTVDQALEHVYLQHVRDPLRESLHKYDANEPKEAMLLEKKLDFDGVGDEYWASLMLQEILKYHEFERERFVESGGIGVDCHALVTGYVRKYARDKIEAFVLAIKLIHAYLS
eukprot:CAMPEP_0197078932 /NCGR_PEP_ID=MMETSP1384-20130603/213368_1 /TAXON_ID=29189 /ORGANISM="Ammonia sp." /LENGTH=341 /DNA_ID=CAMNT_0042517801 /DNA_START=205 /DNA_END=1226 /DNA_ORIENTATION=+